LGAASKDVGGRCPIDYLSAITVAADLWFIGFPMTTFGRNSFGSSQIHVKSGCEVILDGTSGAKEHK
jgi:hypothetical protein